MQSLLDPSSIPSASVRNASIASHADEAIPDVAMEAIARFLRTDANLVSWRRELPSGLDVQLEEWARRSSAHFDEIITLRRYDLTQATEGLPAPARDWLTRDIRGLLARLAKLAGARRLRVFFGAIRTNQCSKFHTDFVRYRLITTYVGPGTELVPDHAVDRAALEHPADCPCDANTAIVRDAAAVRHAVPGEVLLMRGEIPDGRGAVHRSPSIQGTGRVRVVLIANTVHRF